MRAKGAKRAMVAGAIIAELAVLDYAAWANMMGGVSVEVSREELAEAAMVARRDMREG